MRLLHCADLHIGRRLFGFSLLEDQRHALFAIAALAKEYAADAVLIAGDVFDKPVPSEAAVAALDDFLTALQQQGTAVFLIAGNHDSADRLQFMSRILNKTGVYIAGTFTGGVPRVRLQDACGPVDFYMLPYLRPPEVRPFFLDMEINTHEDAVRAALSTVSREENVRSVLLAHQFVSAAGETLLRSDSETASIGGLDCVDASVLKGFSYVALGHLHGAQRAGGEFIRYAGSPLRYSFSELNQQKSVALVELGESGADITLLPVPPLHPMREVTASMAELMKGEGSEDYLHVLLTDEEEVSNAMQRLRELYPNLMYLNYANRVEYSAPDILPLPITAKDPIEQFMEFYLMQNGEEIASDELGLFRQLFTEEEGGTA
ncbi:MAG TPA: exonuclease SbcCD subunit D [Feifaniaceae bacterium]|nr:exonuclease SbcCD subunit D [Feifaniaceae bacterium]